MLPKPLAVTIVLCLCAPAYAYVLRSPSPRSHVAAYTPRFGLSTAAIDTAAVQTEDSLDNSVDNTENRADLTVAKTNMPALAKAAAVRLPGLATTGAIALAAPLGGAHWDGSERPGCVAEACAASGHHVCQGAAASRRHHPLRREAHGAADCRHRHGRSAARPLHHLHRDAARHTPRPRALGGAAARVPDLRRRRHLRLQR